MAKVSGPLFSLEASGSYGGAVTFAKWKGRQYARQLVIPANPHSADQETARNYVRIAGAVQHWINVSTMLNPTSATTDKLAIIAITPATFSWNGFLTDTLVGVNQINIQAALTAWGALDALGKQSWDTEAAALNPAYMEVAQTIAGGAYGPSLTPGNVFYVHQYTLYLMGLQAAPGAVPTNYA